MSCQCDLYQEQVNLYEARMNEAIAEAEKYRLLWQASASCLSYNSDKIKARGEDEKIIIKLAKETDHGRFWSGKTKGWL